jgi:hypothetical protein
MEINSQSLVYIKARVCADKLTGDWDYDPTHDPVDFAFTGIEGPDSDTTWYTGLWETRNRPHPFKYVAKCLVGHGSPVELTTGSYQVWVRITDDTETPVEYAGVLEVNKIKK